MITIERRSSRAAAAMALCWATAGCADPCVDDGLLQAPEGNCPAISGDGTDGTTEPTTTEPTGDTVGPDCNNGIQDGDETDVDCGGSCGDTCGGGQGCGDDDDCVSNDCGNDGTCEDPQCSVDGMVNGDETDVDCGGGTCPACDDGEICIEPSDCMSEICDAGICIPPDPSCRDGVLNGDETDVDCGGPTCPGCDDGEDCVEDGDCISQLCDTKTDTCLAPSCDDGVINGGETDLDCGGPCGPTCDPGEGCLVGGDCVTQGCDPGTSTCNDFLSVDASPSCSSSVGMPVGLSATAMGGSGMYSYAWTPDDGTLSDPTMATTDANPVGFQSYTVTVDDGFAMAQDSVVVIDSAPFDLENNCSLYTADFDVSASGADATISYDIGGTRACETGNNEFGLHLCEGVVFSNTRLVGTLEVTNDPGNDDDWMGLVWGAQDNANFYSMTWKRQAQNGFACPTPAGILVRRVEGPDFDSLTIDDYYCEPDTPRSTLLLDSSMTTTDGWEEGESYTVTIDFTDLGSDVTVVRDSDAVQITAFTVADTTFTSGFFGSTTASQQGACVGPLFAECL
ncbi:MAG: hypothetical protein AB1Z98_18210 [Nannocystaceae bacterium]